MKKNFALYSKYYDYLYNDKNYKLESSYVYKKLKKHRNDLNSLLELGCGSGGHAKYLVNKFTSIIGIDISKEMVFEANQKKIPNFNAKVSDITNFSINQKFDTAIALFHVISYLNNNIDLINCFNCVNKHLKKDGLFMFDFWYTPCVLNIKPSVKIKRFSNKDISILRISEPSIESLKNLVTVDFEILIQDNITKELIKLNESHHMRHFSIPEIELLAKQTGFELISKEEFLSNNLPSETTWGVSVILKKI